MKTLFQRTAMIILAVTWLLVGCAAANDSETTQPGDTPPDTGDAAPEPTAPAAPRGEGEADDTDSQILSDEAQVLVNIARADLREKLCISRDQIALQSLEAVDFPDASLGVPTPGQVYAQVVTPGYVIRLQANDNIYEYHGSDSRVVFAPEESTDASFPGCP